MTIGEEMMRFALYAFSAAAAAMLVAAPANAEVKIKLEEVAGGLTYPLAMVSIPDGSGRKAVIEQHGVVRIIDARGRLLPEPLPNIQAKLPQLHPLFDEHRGLHAPWAGKYIFGDWSKGFAAMGGQIFVATKGGDGKWTQ